MKVNKCGVLELFPPIQELKTALPLRCMAVRCNNTGDPTCINVIQICIKSHFSVLSLSYDVRYEPINFVVSGAVVPKKFRLENLLKNSFCSRRNFFFGEVLVVMCSKHKRNFKN